MAGGNRLLVFGSATFRLDSLSGILDARRELCTRIPCRSLPLHYSSRATSSSDSLPSSPSSVWRRPTASAAEDSQASSSTSRPTLSTRPIEPHRCPDRQEAQAWIKGRQRLWRRWQDPGRRDAWRPRDRVPETGSKVKAQDLGVALELIQSHSNRAREERALAAEKRLAALSQKSTTKGEFAAGFRAGFRG